MEYKGNLYGKVGSSYIPLVMTTEDVDKLEQEVKHLREVVNKNCNTPDVSNSVFDCPYCGMEWDTEKQNSCKCGAYIGKH